MSSNMITKTLYVDNMTCVNCENIIERRLSKIPGISSVTASYSKGTATVTFDAEMIDLEKIIEILREEHYYAREEKAGNPGAQRMAGDSSFTRPGADANSSQNPDMVKRQSKTDLLGIVIIIFALYLIANRFGLFNIFNSFPIAKDGMGYGMLFLIGVLTSVHCVAMCGGICLSQCVPKKEGIFTNRFSAMRPSLLYNTGRVISYTIIGGIIGAIGSVVSFSGTMKGIVQILAGVFMVIMGLNMLNVFPWLRRLNPRMPKIFAKKIYTQRKSNSPLYIGLLNGLMPCGPLQAMQLYALSTGSPFKGALSMFLFSVGTVPLLFAFGALSSFLSKKFTSKMMAVSAALVVFLGIFMFSNGMSLSGIALPTLPAFASTKQDANVATLQGDVQVVTSGIGSGSYEPIIVQKGIPVKWTIKAEDGQINGCNNSIIVQKYSIQKKLEVGDNLIEFTPTETGTIPFSCWMGMIRSNITVVDDLSKVDSSVIKDAQSNTTTSSGSCC
ncbi:MAG TPA: sulfite exporter TauE/SafE family protein [Mobilitalea sp.]|nr:sulfite exporter TauE/SafE family protein [Mobilitalea sp.]